MEWFNLQNLPVNLYFFIIFPCTYIFTRFRWLVSNKDFINPIKSLFHNKIFVYLMAMVFYGIFLLLLNWLSKKIQNNIILMTFLGGSLIGLMVASLSDSDAMIGTGILMATLSSLMGCVTLAYIIVKNQDKNYYGIIAALILAVATKDLLTITLG